MRFISHNTLAICGFLAVCGQSENFYYRLVQPIGHGFSACQNSMVPDLFVPSCFGHHYESKPVILLQRSTLYLITAGHLKSGFIVNQLCYFAKDSISAIVMAIQLCQWRRYRSVATSGNVLVALHRKGAQQKERWRQRPKGDACDVKHLETRQGQSIAMHEICNTHCWHLPSDVVHQLLVCKLWLPDCGLSFKTGITEVRMRQTWGKKDLKLRLKRGRRNRSPGKNLNHCLKTNINRPLHRGEAGLKALLDWILLVLLTEAITKTLASAIFPSLGAHQEVMGQHALRVLWRFSWVLRRRCLVLEGILQ